MYKDIENVKGRRGDDYIDEIDYLISSGIAREVRAISSPMFPLHESGRKNLLKLYLNDVGLLTVVLYRNNVAAILNDEARVNLGAVYECVEASELIAHDNALFYYDNRTRGEVDYLINDYSSLTVVPIEVKYGNDCKRYSALSRFMATPDYNIKRGFVLSNSREVETVGGVTYIPVYYAMFLGVSVQPDEELI